jgi:hypothetical protein
MFAGVLPVESRNENIEKVLDLVSLFVIARPKLITFPSSDFT